jgi:hypothetical protein
LVQAFLKKWWVESDFKASNLPLSLRFKGSGCHCNSVALFSLSFEKKCSGMTTFRYFKTYIPSALKHLSGCHFFGKKRNIIATFQSTLLTEQPNTLDNHDRFDLKCFRNFPIRIEIIIVNHICIFFLPRVDTL